MNALRSALIFAKSLFSNCSSSVSESSSFATSNSYIMNARRSSSNNSATRFPWASDISEATQKGKGSPIYQNCIGPPVLCHLCQELWMIRRTCPGLSECCYVAMALGFKQYSFRAAALNLLIIYIKPLHNSSR